MLESERWDKIKKLLQGQCNVVWKTDIVVSDYKEVIHFWKHYKRTGELLLEQKEIKDTFEFHSNTFDHIVLYYSIGQSTSLLLCRIDMRNINVIIPSKPLHKYGTSFIATYT